MPNPAQRLDRYLRLVVITAIVFSSAGFNFQSASASSDRAMELPAKAQQQLPDAAIPLQTSALVGEPPGSVIPTTAPRLYLPVRPVDYTVSLPASTGYSDLGGASLNAPTSAPYLSLVDESQNLDSTTYEYYSYSGFAAYTDGLNTSNSSVPLTSGGDCASDGESCPDTGATCSDCLCRL